MAPYEHAFPQYAYLYHGKVRRFQDVLLPYEAALFWANLAP